MANSERQLRTPQPPPSQPHGIPLSKLDLGYLRQSYGRLFKHAPTLPNGAGHPQPANLTTKEAYVRAISNWMLSHGDEKTSAECSTCNGPMDLGFVTSGVIPSACVFCGDSDVEDDDGPVKPKSAPKNDAPDDEAWLDEEDEDAPEGDEVVADEDAPIVDEDKTPPDSEDDAAPESGKVPTATKPKTKAVRKVKAKKEPKPGQVAAKTKGGKLVKADEPAAKASAPKSEVVDTETKALLDDVERVRSGLSKGVQDVYAQMWDAGRWFATTLKSKAWAKHPSGFTTWKAFVEGCFGVLVNEKRVEELVTFYKSNKEVPQLSGGLKLPQLPKIRNPQPKKNEGKEIETSPAFDPKNISIAGVFARKQRIPFLTEKGKPAKSLKDRPICFLKSDNGVTIKIAIGQTPKGTMVALVSIDRE